MAGARRGDAQRACAARARAAIARSRSTPRPTPPRPALASSWSSRPRSWTSRMPCARRRADDRAGDAWCSTIQNGLGNVERIQRVLGAENLLFGIAGGFGAEMRGPATSTTTAWRRSISPSCGAASRRAWSGSREVWREAGFTVNAYDDLWPVVWSKLVANVAFSAICTVTGMRAGQVRANESAWGVAAPASRRRRRSPPPRASGSPMTTRRAGSGSSPARSRTRGPRCIRTSWPGAARRSIQSRAAWSRRAPGWACRRRPAPCWSSWSKRSGEGAHGDVTARHEAKIVPWLIRR